MCRGWGFHGAHAGSRQRSPQRAPSLRITRAAKTYLAKTRGGLSAHRLARRQFHAHSGWLIQISGNGDSGTQFNSQWNGKTTSAAAQSVRGCSAWSSEARSVARWCACSLPLTRTRPGKRDMNLNCTTGPATSALHLPVEPGGVPVPLLSPSRRPLSPRPATTKSTGSVVSAISRRARSRDANPLSRLTEELAQRIRKMHVGASRSWRLCPTARPAYKI